MGVHGVVLADGVVAGVDVCWRCGDGGSVGAVELELSGGGGGHGVAAFVDHAVVGAAEAGEVVAVGAAAGAESDGDDGLCHGGYGIREAMKISPPAPILANTTIVAAETYIGRAGKNKHVEDRDPSVFGRHGPKVAVFTLIDTEANTSWKAPERIWPMASFPVEAFNRRDASPRLRGASPPLPSRVRSSLQHTEDERPATIRDAHGPSWWTAPYLPGNHY
jgi:hypothetical protein